MKPAFRPVSMFFAVFVSTLSRQSHCSCLRRPGNAPFLIGNRFSILFHGVSIVGRFRRTAVLRRTSQLDDLIHDDLDCRTRNLDRALACLDLALVLAFCQFSFDEKIRPGFERSSEIGPVCRPRLRSCAIRSSSANCLARLASSRWWRRRKRPFAYYEYFGSRRLGR